MRRRFVFKDPLINQCYQKLWPHMTGDFTPSILRFDDREKWRFMGLYYRRINPKGSPINTPVLEMRIKSDGKLDYFNCYRNHSLHREDGPARAYANDFTEQSNVEYEYWLRGVQVPKIVVMNRSKQSISSMLRQQNTEVQRIRIEQYGWLKFLKKTKAEVIDTATNEIENTNETLFSINRGRATQWNGNGYERTGRHLFFHVFVCACPSTGRVYALSVPSTVVSCFQARRWLLGRRLNKVKLIGAS